MVAKLLSSSFSSFLLLAGSSKEWKHSSRSVGNCEVQLNTLSLVWFFGLMDRSVERS